MSEKFVYLMHESEAECFPTQQRLKEAGIESEVEDYAQNAGFRVYGANSLLGKKILVPQLKLAMAQELLGITSSDNKIDNDIKKEDLSFARSRRPFYLIVKILIAINLLGLLALLLFEFFQNLRLNQ